MITRSIGKVLRGKATPFQLALACVLGAMLGFLPGYADGAVFMHAPGLVLTLFAAVVILNANLPLAGLVGAAAKLASLVLMPASFELGRFVLDGPLQGVMQKAINAPVLALFGFEYYATTGGLVMGLLFGIVAAFIVIGLVRSFRARMSRLEEGSEAYKKYASKWWVKILAFILIGGNKGKRTYAELNQRTIGNPIRILGVVVVVLVVGLVYLVTQLMRDEIVAASLRRGLESANGATVDIERAELDIPGARLTITGLAMADPQALDTDLFRAATIEAKISGRDLLRKRIALDNITARDAYTGEKRQIPGRLTVRRPAPVPEPRQPGDKTLEDYLEDAKLWRDRLAQVRRWLDEMDKEPDPAADPTAARETLRERLAREAREKGYARVVATHLIEGAPTLLIRQLQVDGLRSGPLPGKTEPEILDVRGENLSTHPRLVPEPAKLTIRSRSDSLRVEAALAGFMGTGRESTLAVAYSGLPAEVVGRQLRVGGDEPLQGGTISFSGEGTLGSGGRIHLPLSVVIRDTTVSVPQLGAAPVSELILPLGVTGRVDDPRILWDQSAFADALAKAGANELAGRVRAEAEKAIGKVTSEVTARIDDKTDDLKEKAGEKLKEETQEKIEDLKQTLPGLLSPRRNDRK